ncbi:MAG: hypothetical protein IPG01_13225 [Chitinophagaceae bacterium]|nr:hypothetical protein [Chitinophagaceae bacterium]
MNHIFQIVVPFNYNDAKFRRPGFVETLWCPPLFGDTTKIQPIFSESKLFDSSKPITDEKGTFVFHQDAQMFEEITFLDKVTGKPFTEKFDPSKIASIEFLRKKIQ